MVGWLVCWSGFFSDPHGAPYWPTWPCFQETAKPPKGNATSKKPMVFDQNDGDGSDSSDDSDDDDDDDDDDSDDSRYGLI